MLRGTEVIKAINQREKIILQHICHPIPPFFDDDSKILILGSFPSVKSREQGFFYGHPQNRFWKVIAGVFEKNVPQTIEEKKALLKECGVAVWDVIASCEILGSSDSSIKNVTANDISGIIKTAEIRMIITNGRTAEKYYNKYIGNKITVPSLCLPSTSPANDKKSLQALIEEWKIIKI